MKRECQFSFITTKEAKEAYKQAAGLCGLSCAEWCRRTLANAANQKFNEVGAQKVTLTAKDFGVQDEV